MSDKSQMLKGILEGCILRVISNRETYGYEISERLKASGFSEISEGTIYPLLMRLEKSGLIAATFRDSPFGPKRKYFNVTQKGLEEIESFLIHWQELQKSVNTLFIIKGDEAL